MRFTNYKTESLYNNVIKAIIDTMNENNVNEISMEGTCFEKYYKKIFLKDNKLYYPFYIGNKKISDICIEGHCYLTIHRFDLIELLKIVAFKLNNVYCSYEVEDDEEEIV